MNAFNPPHTFRGFDRAEAIERTASVEFNKWFPAMPWQLRCYGPGRCTHGDGVPNRFTDKSRAQQVAATWIADGVSPADQVLV